MPSGTDRLPQALQRRSGECSSEVDEGLPKGLHRLGLAGEEPNTAANGPFSNLAGSRVGSPVKFASAPRENDTRRIDERSSDACES